MRYLLTTLALLAALSLSAQRPLTYYLPAIEYDSSIPTPESFLGWQIGDWHISHDLQQQYMKELAESSDRIVLREYGRTYEGRPLLHLIITSPENHARLDELQARHVALSESGTEAPDLDETPLVLYQGFSIHGNEPSGGNAAPLVAYYLAAGQSPEIEQLLDQTIILFDPCYNPDGFQRFSTWVNMHKNENMTPDPQDREYNEEWPRGRTNHYWFDLNRDWLPVQHPESKGRVQAFQEWRPNILTDHHEMGTNATFFFMPGEPTRVHPFTPNVNQELTARIGSYHAEALDRIGSLYYSGEGYDDYYIGKGSTYPDLQGTIGILFEQASSRGHMQESDNGLLTFPFTIRNQVVTALSTQAAAVGLKNELLRYQRDYYRNQQQPAGGYLIGMDGDKGRSLELIEMLRTHDVKVELLTADYRTREGQSFKANEAFFIPNAQRQQQLIKAMFEPIFDFEDSLFYDVSTWTLPYAFNLPYTTVGGGSIQTGELSFSRTDAMGSSDYAYLLPWDDYYAGKVAYALMDAGLRLKVAHTPFTAANGGNYAAGTILIPVANQGDLTPAAVRDIISAANTGHMGVSIQAVPSGVTPQGGDLGSRDGFSTLRKPEVLLLIDGGVSSYNAGEAWHLLDQRFGIPVTKMELDDFGRADLERYNTIIMVNGSYNSLGSSGAAKLKSWLQPDRVILAEGQAVQWLSQNDLANVKIKSGDEDEDEKQRRPYGSLDRDRGGRVLGGAILETQADLTHPLLYGFRRTQVPVFRRGNLAFEVGKNPYSTPLVYTDEPVLSGYVHPESEAHLAGTASLIVTGRGGGRVICFADNPNFRAFWFGTNRLFLNGLFFGSTISGGSLE